SARFPSKWGPFRVAPGKQATRTSGEEIAGARRASRLSSTSIDRADSFWRKKKTREALHLHRRGSLHRKSKGWEANEPAVARAPRRKQVRRAPTREVWQLWKSQGRRLYSRGQVIAAGRGRVAAFRAIVFLIQIYQTGSVCVHHDND
ncbi:unnamed protein product, partial [Amoebophrya sp. A120]